MPDSTKIKEPEKGRRRIEPAALNSASGNRQLRDLGTLRFVKRVAMKRVTV